MKVITITVKSRSKRNEVEEINGTEFVVRVKAAPEKGKANKEAIKTIARHLGLPSSQLMLTKGEKYETKTILVMD